MVAVRQRSVLMQLGGMTCAAFRPPLAGAMPSLRHSTHDACNQVPKQQPGSACQTGSTAAALPPHLHALNLVVARGKVQRGAALIVLHRAEAMVSDAAVPSTLNVLRRHAAYITAQAHATPLCSRMWAKQARWHSVHSSPAQHAPSRSHPCPPAPPAPSDPPRCLPGGGVGWGSSNVSYSGARLHGPCVLPQSAQHAAAGRTPAPQAQLEQPK